MFFTVPAQLQVVASHTAKLIHLDGLMRTPCHGLAVNFCKYAFDCRKNVVLITILVHFKKKNLLMKLNIVPKMVPKRKKKYRVIQSKDGVGLSNSSFIRIAVLLC